jgi:large subunit ribosomal protein L25
MSETTLEIQPRSLGGTPVARRLRREGLVPGVLYGQGRDPLPFQVELPKLRAAMTSEAGRHAILQLTIPGEPRPTAAILKDLQLDPVRDRVTHIDLLAISMRERIVTPVAVHVEGDAPGVTAGGVLETPVNEVEIEVLPTQMPDAIVVDISGLEVGGSIRLGDVPAPEGVTWSSDPDTVLVTITASTTAADLESIDEGVLEQAAADAGLDAEIDGPATEADVPGGAGGAGGTAGQDVPDASARGSNADA